MISYWIHRYLHIFLKTLNRIIFFKLFIIIKTVIPKPSIITKSFPAVFTGFFLFPLKSLLKLHSQTRFKIIFAKNECRFMLVNFYWRRINLYQFWFNFKNKSEYGTNFHKRQLHGIITLNARNCFLHMTVSHHKNSTKINIT